MMKKLVAGCSLVILPILVLAQQDISGIWRLKEKRSISGADYDNGIPKLIRIDKEGKAWKFQMVTSYNDRDTTEVLLIEPVGVPVETITGANRKKTTSLEWNPESNEWIKKTRLSAKNEFLKPQVNILETLKLADVPSELSFSRDYTGPDNSGNNADYKMLGIYEKTSEEALALETAKGKGIQFVEGLSWKQILEKAKKENKLIFVDCYATWCVPCKKMDKEVYDLNMVGDEMNKSFISVKVQMDTSKNDKGAIKLTYPIARYLEKEFGIEALPTFLFFNSKGQIVHRATGSFSGNNFVKLVRDAADPSSQVYSLIRKVKAKQLTPPQIAALANKLQGEGLTELALTVARYYFDQHLYRLERKEIFTLENMKFYSKFQNAISSADAVFHYIMNNTAEVDSLIGVKTGFAAGIVQSVIRKEEIQPFWIKADAEEQTPDWESLSQTIEKKYGRRFAYQTIINAKASWYGQKKIWKPYLENLVLQIEMHEDLNQLSWLSLNSAAWRVFEHSESKELLDKALHWSELAIKLHTADTTIKDAPWGSILDTYANLLYKLGRKDEAIKFYQDKILSAGLQSIRLYERYVKIFRGVPTWTTENN